MAAIPFPVRNWLVRHFLANPQPPKWHDGEPIVFVEYDTFADFLLANEIAILPNLDAWKAAGFIEDVMAQPKQGGDPFRLVGIRKTVLMPTSPTEGAGDANQQYLTMDSIAVFMRLASRTIERRLNKDNGPAPDTQGGGGRPHLWIWANIRPWLEMTFGRTLPARFPELRDG